MGYRGEHYSFKGCRMENVLKDVEKTLNSAEEIVDNIYSIAVVEVLKTTDGYRKGTKLLYILAENWILNNDVFLNANYVLEDDDEEYEYNEDLDFAFKKYWGKIDTEWIDPENSDRWVKEGRFKLTFYKFKNGKLIVDEE